VPWVVDGDMWSYSLYQREIRKSQGNGIVGRALCLPTKAGHYSKRISVVDCYEGLMSISAASRFVHHYLLSPTPFRYLHAAGPSEK